MAGSRVLDWRVIVAGVVISAAAWEKAERRRLSARRDQSEPDTPAAQPAPADAPVARARRQRRVQRFATSLVLVSLFFAGAAFTAGAGNQAVQADDAIAAEAPDAVPTDPAAADPASEPAESPPPAPEVVPESAPEAAPAPPSDVAVSAAPAPPADAAADPTPATAPPAVAATASAEPAQSAPAPHRSAPQRRRPAPKQAARLMPIPTAAPVFFPTVPFDLQAWVHDNPASPLGAAAVAIAKHFIGTPYVWGGAGPAAGFDCSGFTMYVYAQLGIALPHYAASQFAGFAQLISFELEPGDLVFFEPRKDGPGHVAIYAGNDTIIEAPHTGALVRIGSLSGSAAALGFLGAVRPYAAAETSTRGLFAFIPAASPARHSGIGMVGQVYAV